MQVSPARLALPPLLFFEPRFGLAKTADAPKPLTRHQGDERLVYLPLSDEGGATKDIQVAKVTFGIGRGAGEPMVLVGEVYLFWVWHPKSGSSKDVPKDPAAQEHVFQRAAALVSLDEWLQTAGRPLRQQLRVAATTEFRSSQLSKQLEVSIPYFPKMSRSTPWGVTPTCLNWHDSVIDDPNVNRTLAPLPR